VFIITGKHSHGEARYRHHILSCAWIPVVSREVLLKKQTQTANWMNVTAVCAQISPAFQV